MNEIPKSARERAIDAMNDVMTLRLAPRKISLDFHTLSEIIREDPSVSREGLLFGMTVELVQSGMPIVCYPEPRYLSPINGKCPTCDGEVIGGQSLHFEDGRWKRL